MAFDTFVLGAITAELKKTVLNSRIMKVHQPNPHNLILKTHGEFGNSKILISAHPLYNRIQLTEQNYENPQQPPLFCMVMRKYLEGGKILAIEQKGLERILEITILTTNEMGDKNKKTLVVEFMSKHSNIILLDENKIIIDGIKRYSHHVSRYREVLPGRAYLYPPPQNKISLLELNDTLLTEILMAQPLDATLVQTVQNKINGFSPALAREVLVQANLEQNLTIEELGEYEINKLWQTLKIFAEIFQNQKFKPCLIYVNNQLKDYSSLPLNLGANSTCQNQDSMSQTLETYFTAAEDNNVFAGRQRELNKIVTGHIQRLEKKIALQKKDLNQAEAGDKHRLAGQLLSAYVYQLHKGMSEIELADYTNDNQLLTIALDATLSPQENISRYFKKYTKCKNSRSAIQEQLSDNEAELNYLFSVVENLEQCQQLVDIADIKQELIFTGYLKQGSKKQPKIKEQSQPRSYTVTGGFTVLVGKNNQQNDKLTLKIASKNDLWLHTQKIHGSHTIIRAEGKEIPTETIQAAAEIAAWFSKGQQSSQVPVDYTLVSFVKKPSGAKPGLVIYTQQKTMYVTPHNPDLPPPTAQ